MTGRRQTSRARSRSAQREESSRERGRGREDEGGGLRGGTGRRPRGQPRSDLDRGEGEMREWGSRGVGHMGGLGFGRPRGL